MSVRKEAWASYELTPEDRKRLNTFFKELMPRGSDISIEPWGDGVEVSIVSPQDSVFQTVEPFPSEDWKDVQAYITKNLGFYISTAGPDEDEPYIFNLLLYPVEHVEQLPKYVYHMTNLALKDKIRAEGLKSGRGKVYVFSDLAMVDDLLDSFSPSEPQYQWQDWLLVKIDTERLDPEAMRGVDKEFSQKGIYWISGEVPSEAIVGEREFRIDPHSGDRKWASMSAKIASEAWFQKVALFEYYRIPKEDAKNVTVEDVAKRWQDERDKLYDVNWTSGQYHILAPLATLKKYREYDRAGADAYPRGDSEERIQKVMESIKEKGWTIPVHVTVYWSKKPPKVTEGNHRLVAAERLGIDYIPVVFFFHER